MNTLLFTYTHILYMGYYKYNKEGVATVVEVMKTGIMREDTAP